MMNNPFERPRTATMTTDAELEAMHGPEWLEWWKSLDHSGCTRLGWPSPDTAGYLACASMHCPKCNRTTGGQGHFDCKLERLTGIPYPS